MLQFFQDFLRKTVMLSLLLVACVGGLQVKAQDCGGAWNPQIEWVNGTCLDNAMFIYWIADGDGNPLASLSSTSMTNVHLYYRLSTESQWDHSLKNYDGGKDTIFLAPGTYQVGMEGTCINGSGTDLHTDPVTVTLTTSYVIPTGPVMPATAYKVDDFGTHPTLDCDSTGLVQLKIEHGRFPYIVTVVRDGHDDDTLTVRVFQNHMYNGTDDRKYNYEDYYTIDHLPAGTWRFYVHDGCEYGIPYSVATIQQVDFPTVDTIDIYASSGKKTDSNIVKIRANMQYTTPHKYYPYEYYIKALRDSMSYRIVRADNSEQTKPWKLFPYSITNQTTLYDTMNVDKYCDLWNVPLRFEYRLEMAGCYSYHYSHVFSYKKPNETGFMTKPENETSQLRRKAGEDCKYEYGYYTKSNGIYYDPYRPNEINPGDDAEKNRHHYTYPLTWLYLNHTNDTIKVDTVQAISDESLFSLEEAGFTYEQLNSAYPNSLSTTLHRKLVDAKGCVLYDSANDTLTYVLTKKDIEPEVEVTKSNANHCCIEPRNIFIKTAGLLKDSLVIDTIKLVASPGSPANKYNFIASYNRQMLTWSMEPQSNEIHNVLAVEQLRSHSFGEPTGRAYKMSDYCLPSGSYTFEIICNDCKTFYKTYNPGFPDVYIVELQEMPVHSETQICTELHVSYTQGKYVLKKSGGSITDVTRFQVVSGVTGGYPNGTYHRGDDIVLSLPGQYVIKMFPYSSNANEICEEQAVYDTVYNKGALLNIAYEGALLCKADDVKGIVYIGGKDGTAPYTFSLYDTVDAIGNPIVIVEVDANGVKTILYNPDNLYMESQASNGQVGVRIQDVPMGTGKHISCRVQDHCGASFPVNFRPQVLSIMQKAWIEDDKHESTVCEGDSIRVYALEYGTFFSYDWSGPDGFTSHEANPYLTVPRGLNDGWYYVEIKGHNCKTLTQVTDSVHLIVKRSPSIQITSVVPTDTTVCAGDTIDIAVKTINPTSNTDSVYFSLAFSNEMGVEIRDYVGINNEVQHIKYCALYPTDVYSVSIVDEDCGYYHPADSIMVKTKSNRLTNCNLLTQGDTVCYNNPADLYAKAQELSGACTIQWFHDFALTSLAQEDHITAPGETSHYHTASLTQDTVLYLKVDDGVHCPSHHAVATETVAFVNEGMIPVGCGDVFRLYDTGGPDGNYGQYEDTIMHFRGNFGERLTIHFDEFDLASTSSLYIFSGNDAIIDNLLYRLTANSQIPDIIVSNDHALTLYFVSEYNTAAGWSALIQTAGSIAVAEVRLPVTKSIYEEVCQTRGGTYDDSRYHVIADGIVSADTMSKIIKKAGSYTFSHTFSRPAPLCDSIVTFHLTVKQPIVRTITNVVTTTLEPNFPYLWHGKEYRLTDEYYDTISAPEACDMIDVLHLVVLKVDNKGNVTICKGDNAELSIIFETPKLPPIFTTAHHVGDVLCTDNTIMSPDSFLLSGKMAKGVVFWLDPLNNNSGKAIALRDAYEGYNERGWKNETTRNPGRLPGECIWASNKMKGSAEIYKSIFSSKNYLYPGALFPGDNGKDAALSDMNGYGNTDTIRKSTYNVDMIDTSNVNLARQKFKDYAPAAYYCWYYNEDTARVKHGGGDGDNTGVAHTGWYLPSLGEFSVYFAYRMEVSRTLEMLARPPYNAKLMQCRMDYGSYFYDESYWTSTEGMWSDHSCAYRVSGKGQIIYHKQNYHKGFTDNNPTFVRAIIAF